MVVFVSLFKQGFGIPIGNFFHGLLHYYKIELKVLEYFDLQLRESNKGWHSEWFLIANQHPELPRCTGYEPVSMPEWSNQPTSEEQVQVDELLEKITDLKAQGLIAGTISINFCQRVTQRIKYRVHPSYEYSRLDDPTREVHGNVPNPEVIDRLTSCSAQTEATSSRTKEQPPPTEVGAGEFGHTGEATSTPAPQEGEAGSRAADIAMVDPEVKKKADEEARVEPQQGELPGMTRRQRESNPEDFSDEDLAEDVARDKEDLYKLQKMSMDAGELLFRVKGTRRAKYYHLKSECLEAELKEAKEDAANQLLQRNLEKDVLAAHMKGLEVELEELQKVAGYVMDVVQPNANPAALTPLLDRLKAALGRLKALLKDTTVECIKNAFTLVASHFLKLALEWSATGVTADFNVDLIPEVVDQYHDVVESIVNDLDT
uniref:Uncharacterized protein n=1 Tax=Setaria viridis TaxID=4556 RepID=A0A4U6UYC6_SETVI|nr:hypothetical protein SEVIR_4G141200v2 [Setaria viridis]